MADVYNIAEHLAENAAEELSELPGLIDAPALSDLAYALLHAGEDGPMVMHHLWKLCVQLAKISRGMYRPEEYEADIRAYRLYASLHARAEDLIEELATVADVDAADLRKFVEQHAKLPIDGAIDPGFVTDIPYRVVPENFERLHDQFGKEVSFVEPCVLRHKAYRLGSRGAASEADRAHTAACIRIVAEFVPPDLPDLPHRNAIIRDLLAFAGIKTTRQNVNATLKGGRT